MLRKIIKTNFDLAAICGYVQLQKLSVTALINNCYSVQRNLFNLESKCPRPAMSETVAAKEASAVDKLYSLVFHDHSTQSVGLFDLIFF